MERFSPVLSASWNDTAPLNGVGRLQAKSAYAPTAPADTLARSRTIPLHALLQRLSLLAVIELPCAVQIGTFGRDHGDYGPIRTCEWSGGRFKLSGENFTLHLSDATIDSVRLVESTSNGRADTRIEILSANGNVIARIKAMPDHANAAVWQDIMDTFDCA